jgi:hypothetical protein
MEAVLRAIERTNIALKGQSISIEEYRDQVFRQVETQTEDFIRSLPNETEYGAVVALRDYGERNRQYMFRRIQNGMYTEVEEAFRTRSI